jgi:hypothetical protein
MPGNLSPAGDYPHDKGRDEERKWIRIDLKAPEPTSKADQGRRR